MLGLAVLVYGSRLALKALVLYATAVDSHKRDDPSPKHGTSLSELVDRALRILMEGAAACSADDWNWIGPVFQLCGVLQWIVFAILMVGVF